MTHRADASERPASRGGALRRACVLVIAALVLSGCAMAVPEAAETPTPSASAALPTPEPSPTTSPSIIAAPPAQPPRSVAIPAIGVDRPLIDLGIGDDGALEVPEFYDDVGWFTGGGRPGGHGPLVIAGHVASKTSSGVFARLGELQPGDEVVVTDTAGTVFRYVVTTNDVYEKSTFPTAEVFGATAADELRLITCDGFDSSIIEFTDNRVVVAVRR